MALPSFLQRKDKRPAPAAGRTRAADDTQAVQEARLRAKRRLIGAVVLLGSGVAVFPLLFETQPRPLPRSVPMELAGRSAASAPALRGPAPAVTELPAQPMARAPAPEPDPVASTAAGSRTEAKTERVTKPEPLARVDTSAPVDKSDKAGKADKPDAVAKADRSTAPSAAASTTAPARPPAGEGDRARALLEGRAGPVASAPSAPRAERFVVQVGAFTDANTLREVRQRVEKLGLKTYTQTIDTEAGKRTRVRVGPYATRAEADAAGVKLKAAGLPGNVLGL